MSKVELERAIGDRFMELMQPARSKDIYIPLR